MKVNEYKTIPSHTFDEVLTNPAWKRAVETMELPIPLGWDESDKLRVVDLAKVGNLLTVGQTGSGKSVFLNTMICALSSYRTPSQVKFMLVDLKSVEFVPYAKGFAYLQGKVAESDEDAIALLCEATKTAVYRVSLLSNDNIDPFNDEVPSKCCVR